MWFETYYKHRKTLIIATVITALASLLFLPFLKFAFNFEQFFPIGDPDLEYFQEFIEEFETDDNFLLVAFENEPSIFDTSFLRKVKAFSRDAQDIPHVKLVQSLPDFKYPIITPFGPSAVPAVHLNDKSKLEKDSINLIRDERILYNFMSAKANSTVVILKTVDDTQIEECDAIMEGVKELFLKHDLENHHMLGRAYFQSELSDMQFREIVLSTIVSGLLIGIIMVMIFKKWTSILIALGSIGLGLLIFLGVLALFGRQMTLMAALYPILMLIVGTSDVVHIMTKYFDELKKGQKKKDALEVTIKQIGLATLLTSLTTAAGFATLLSSRVVPIKEFGLNAAAGVIIAYIVIITFTCPVMSFFKKEQLIKGELRTDLWHNWLTKFYHLSLKKDKAILWGFLLFIVLSAFGMSKIHTNYELDMNLPRGAKITEDFKFFEADYAGFRPLELAGLVQDGYEVYDYEVMDAINRTETFVKSQDEIQTGFSMATLIKSINQAINGNNYDSYKMPSENQYQKFAPFIESIPIMGADILISKDKRKTRISTKVKDVGAENIKVMGKKIDDWIAENIDPNVIQFKQTGTGLILDKNSEFVRESLLYGLGIALLIVSLLMAMLFRNAKMLFIALIPNLIPLVFAAALIGYLDIALEAGISIVFAIIFGIAVDDTIHFLSKYKLAKDRLGDREAALLVTFQETGKAIIFTTLILFFGFMILLFSKNLPSVLIGMLISVTLISAVIADLFLLPVIIRRLKL